MSTEDAHKQVHLWEPWIDVEQTTLGHEIDAAIAGGLAKALGWQASLTGWENDEFQAGLPPVVAGVGVCAPVVSPASST